MTDLKSKSNALGAFRVLIMGFPDALAAVLLLVVTVLITGYGGCSHCAAYAS